MKKPETDRLRAWRRRKAGVIGLLVAVSAVGGLSLQFDVGPKLILIPVLLLILAIWVWGRRVYACPHCKNPIDLRLPLRRDLKCTKCGRPIMDQNG